MFNISHSDLPECLKDENRISVLFAPIRNRSVNPKDWENKINSWKTIIKVYCESNDVYTFTYSALNKVFIKNGRPPACLLDVLNEMLSSGEIQDLKVFQQKNSRSWRGWAADVLVKKPLSWSYNKLKDSIFTTDINEQPLVHLDVVKVKCNDLLKTVPEKYKNKLISLKDLLKVLDKCPNPNEIENFNLLLHYMWNQNLVDITHLNNTKQSELEITLIKFSDGANNLINELDLNIYTLEQSERIILKSIEDLEDNIQSCINEAKMHLSKNHRQAAKSTLRKKRDMEKILDKKAHALHNVQTLLQQIHETHTNVHVWKSYKNVLSAFDSTFKETGLSEDAIDDTMIKLGEVIDKNQDIQSALGAPTQDLNDSDLEQELAALLEEPPHDDPPDDAGLNTSLLENKLEDLSLNLPEVPDLSPNVSQKDVKINSQ